LKSAQANIDLYAELERVTKIYVAEKTAQASDLLDVQARLLHAGYERTPASDTLATHEEELNDLLGRPVESELTLDPDITLDMVVLQVSNADKFVDERLSCDGPIRVAPATLHAKVGFVHSLRLVGRLEMPSQSLLQLRAVILHPAPDRCVIDMEARSSSSSSTSRSERE